MKKILLIGNILSKKTGTKGVSEHLSERLSSKFRISVASRKKNKFMRILDIIFSVLKFSGTKIHVDIFSGQAFIFGEIASYLGLLRKKQVILSLRGGNLISFYNSNKFRFKNLLSRVNYIQTPSLFLKNYFQNKGFEVNYMPNSIKLENFKFNRKNISKYSLLWVRAFDSTYNPDVPVRILNELIKTYPNATLTMIGPDKGELSEIKKLISKYKLEKKVEILGPIPNEILYKFYQKKNIFINTTSYESFGVCLIEAASCGIPIISNSVGEIDVLWEHRKDIIKVKKNNIDQYVSGIKELFENQKLYENIVMNAREKSEKFAWKIIEPKWINLFK